MKLLSIIGADKMAHHIEDGKLQLLSMDTKIDDYDTNGLSKYIYERIKK